MADPVATCSTKGDGRSSSHLVGADALACEESESSRHFTATSSQDKRVEGTVCCGLTRIGKGCTMRWGR